MVRLNRISAGCRAEIVCKLEFFNPAGSVKDRIGVSMIEAAEKTGSIAPGAVIIEPTSGNTGIALAWVCAIKGYRLILTMPASRRWERITILKALGAKVIVTPAEKGISGAIQKAEEIRQQLPGSFMPQQFANPNNPRIHSETTAVEIWEDTEGRVDAIVSGVGTGGTLTGVGWELKKKNPALQIVAVEPQESPVLSGGKPGIHAIQGIGAGFVPETLDKTLIDEIVTVKSQDSSRMMQDLIRREGILCGMSSGAAVFAALQIASRKEYEGKRVVVILPDTGARYLEMSVSIELRAAKRTLA